MQKMSFHRGETGWFSEQHLRLVYDQESFGTYLTEPFSKEAIRRQIDRKRFDESKRSILVEALKSQYFDIETSATTKGNIESLCSEKTFTITTGHQLSLFTGPLYFVIKVLHVIKQCEELNEALPDYRFVPVYWMASEDHDFEEIQSCTLFNRKVAWETAQQGPVGLFELEGLEAVKVELHELFGNNPESEIHDLIDSLSGSNYARAARRLVNELLGERGLVIIDGDDAALKSMYAPILERELKEQFAMPEVLKVTEQLVKDGGKSQVTPREINLFYNEKGLRSRIQIENGTYFAEGKGELNIDELLKTPRHLSPNVILRPVYQEYILPNLAYVGGGGEISYWLQLKGVFDKAGVTFPLIQIRNSVVWMDRNVVSKLEKIGAAPADIFNDTDAWKKLYVQDESGDELDTSEVDTAFEALKVAVTSLVVGVDSTKQAFAEAELSRMEKQLENLKAKTVRFSKAQHEQAMKAIDFIKSRINPEGGLQEREVNFFQFCNTGEVQPRIQELYDALDPFNGDLIFLIENA